MPLACHMVSITCPVFLCQTDQAGCLQALCTAHCELMSCHCCSTRVKPPVSKPPPPLLLPAGNTVDRGTWRVHAVLQAGRLVNLVDAGH